MRSIKIIEPYIVDLRNYSKYKETNKREFIDAVAKAYEIEAGDKTIASKARAGCTPCFSKAVNYLLQLYESSLSDRPTDESIKKVRGRPRKEK